MTGVTPFKKAELVKGRLEVGHRIRFKTKDGEFGGDVCETQRSGKANPRAQVKLVRTGDLMSVEFENVSPGATQKSPAKKGKP